MAKKALSVMFAVIMMLSCFSIFAFAETTEITAKINAENSITLKAGEKKTFTLSLGGSYTVITTGSKKAEVNIVTKTGNTTSYTALKKADNGNVFDTRTYGLSILGLDIKSADYTFEVSASDGKACTLKLWIIEYSEKYSGFTSYPTTTKVYKEDIDFTVTGSGVSFKTAPDFTGAVFTFNDDSNNPIYTLKGNDVLNVLSAPTFTYEAKKIVYVSIATVLNSRNTVSFSAEPNYIQTVVIKGYPAKAYHFGKNGTIKGSLGNYYFIPDIDLTGATATVTYKSYVGGKTETVNVNKDGKGYYITTSLTGRQNITNQAKVTSNSTATYKAPLYVGNCPTTISIQIEKATFFEMIGIWFGLLFGKYK